MENRKEYFIQSETISFATGITAGTRRTEVVLNSAYERCIGVAIFETKDGGGPYRIGLDDKDKQYISVVHKDMLISSPAAGMKIEDRFLKQNIKAGGHKVQISTAIPANLASDLEYDFVFLLEREPQK
ncbi:hypothetical protein KDU71_02525 [Carboxylicivirga sediminis]|uniref:Uncharacterized protein n=1 Tax=Carboxylicivirga sediminis TaxID=2006564 RepID=A0A941IUZ7_9BACT|nr:hypothetical protein [Carboxylicivirga sediminis]MBR8534420.1 hypothetical protein [Carboxylicivirga sediminis]